MGGCISGLCFTAAEERRNRRRFRDPSPVRRVGPALRAGRAQTFPDRTSLGRAAIAADLGLPDEYKLLKFLGSGGEASTYLVRQIQAQGHSRSRWTAASLASLAAEREREEALEREGSNVSALGLDVRSSTSPTGPGLGGLASRSSAAGGTGGDDGTEALGLGGSNGSRSGGFLEGHGGGGNLSATTATTSHAATLGKLLVSHHQGPGHGHHHGHHGSRVPPHLMKSIFGHGHGPEKDAFALKALERGPSIDEVFVTREVSIQSRLNHVNIIKLHQVLLTPSHLCIKLEYASGGELYDYIKKVKPVGPGRILSEEHARFFFLQFADAVRYLHDHDCAHRDIKLSNILLTSDDPPRIKLADFGLSRDGGYRLDPSTFLSSGTALSTEGQGGYGGNADFATLTVVGTPQYMSKELLEEVRTHRGYNPRCADVWACGVALYVLLMGRFPFRASSAACAFEDVLREIAVAHASPGGGTSDRLRSYVFRRSLRAPESGAHARRAAEMPIFLADGRHGQLDPSGSGSGSGSGTASAQLAISSEARDLLDRMLSLTPAARPTMAGVLAHPWSQGRLDPGHERVIQALREAQRQSEAHMGDGGGAVPLPPVSVLQTEVVWAEALEKLRRLVHEAKLVRKGPEGEISRWTPPVPARLRTALSVANLQAMGGVSRPGTPPLETIDTIVESPRPVGGGNGGGNGWGSPAGIGRPEEGASVKMGGKALPLPLHPMSPLSQAGRMVTAHPAGYSSGESPDGGG